MHILLGGVRDHEHARLTKDQAKNLLHNTKEPKMKRPVATVSARGSNRYSLSEASLFGLSEIKRNFDQSMIKPIKKKQSLLPFNWWRKPDNNSNYEYNEEDSMSIQTETEYCGDINSSDYDLFNDMASIKSQGSTSCTGLSFESANLLKSIKNKNYVSQKNSNGLAILQEKLHMRSQELRSEHNHKERIKSIWV